MATNYFINSADFHMETHSNSASADFWDSNNNNDPFESALSSIVSSPVASPASDGLMLRELIGRLGTICNNSPPNLPLKLAGSQSPQNGDSREGSSVSQQIPFPPKPQIEANGSRKRKSASRGKAKETTDSKVVAEKEEPKAKKSKQEKEQEQEAPEAPKDYIHVRARRGQATDSHSLAERVRREKISERMKFLQDLVPGCNKVTGKAVMLDEIINYVQSLQRQVEFLSMKLSTVNPRMDFSMEAQLLLSKEILQSRGSLPQGVYPLDSSAPALAYGYPLQQVPCMTLPNSMDGFGEAPQVPGFWEDDLQSLVQMGFGPNQPHNFHGQMKIEL